MKTNPENTKLTTVKIIKNVYSRFKQVSFESETTLQRIVNRTLHLYTENEEYRKHINNYTDLQISGSQF